MVMLEYLENHCDKCEFNTKFAVVRDMGNNSFALPDELFSPQPMNLAIAKRVQVEEKSAKVEEKRVQIDEKSAKAEEKSVQVEEKKTKVEEKNVQVKTVQSEGKSAQIEVKSVQAKPLDYTKQRKREAVDKNTRPVLEKCETKKKLQPNLPTKWQVLHNFNAYGDVLEVKSDFVSAFAQSASAINPTDNTFKVKLMDFYELKYIAIGLSCIGHRVDKIPGLYGPSISFDSSGDLILDRISTKSQGKWYTGDIIECTVAFPDNSTSESDQLKVCFHRNGKLVVERKVSMPEGGFFPKIYVFEGIAGSWWNKGEMSRADSISTKVYYFK